MATEIIEPNGKAGSAYRPPGSARTVPARVNLALTIGIVVVNAVLVMGLPLLGLDILAWLALSLLIVLAAPLHWGLIHEGIHRLLLPGRRRNDAAARVLAVAFGAPFAILKFGHLFHHRHNRTALDRTEHAHATDFAGRMRARVVFYFRLFGGLYLGEVVLGLLLLAPAGVLRSAVRRTTGTAPDGLEPLAAQIDRDLLDPATIRSARVDALAVLAIGAAAVWAWGPDVWLVALTFFARGAVVSVLDNAFHYSGPLDELHAADNARLPRLLALGVLNSNYHGIHHRYPRISWRHLPAVHAATVGETRFDGAYLALIGRQLRGPVFVSPP